MTGGARHLLERPLFRPSGRILLLIALLIAALVGSRAIANEGSFFLPGDPPRYLMNGVFLYDFLRSGTEWSVGEAMTYAERYYARYPALSLGHHPPLLPASLVPFYGVFGVSVLSARLAVLTFFAIAVVLLYRLVARIYDRNVAGWACVLFVTSPIIGSFGQRVLSEMPTIALVLAALNLVARFRESGRVQHYVLFIALAAASLLCRPTAIYMFPAYGAFLLVDGGVARLRQRPAAVATLLAGAACIAIALAFLTLSPFNAGVVLDAMGRGTDLSTVRAMLATIVRERPLFVVLIAGTLASIVRRDRRLLLTLVWIVSVLGSAIVLTGSIEPGRYTILAVPAYCIVAASLCRPVQSRLQYAGCAVLLASAAGLQLWNGSQRPSWTAPGYEAAARYIVSQMPTPTILYSASVDPGYFVFFVRKHDPAQRLVVLRSDKLLTTSRMAQLSVEDRIEAPEDIYPMLQRYGTRFVVIEDRPSGAVVLDWLRDALRTDRFVERQRFLIGDGHPRVRGVSLVVYEYRDAVGPAPDAELDLNLPLVGRRIRVRLADLLPPQ